MPRPRALSLTDEELEIADKNGVPYHIIRERVNSKKWTVEKAINTKLRYTRKYEELGEDLLKIINHLYKTGYFVKEIADKVDLPDYKIIRIIESQKLLDPDTWPDRVTNVHFKPEIDLIVVRTYDCSECGMYFTHENLREFQDLRIACPVCATDEFVVYKGLKLMHV